MKTKCFLGLGLTAIIVMMSACERDKYCRCITVEEVPQTMIVNVDQGMNCQAITKIGVERIVNQSLVRDMVSVKCKRTAADENQHLY